MGYAVLMARFSSQSRDIRVTPILLAHTFWKSNLLTPHGSLKDSRKIIPDKARPTQPFVTLNDTVCVIHP